MILNPKVQRFFEDIYRDDKKHVTEDKGSKAYIVEVERFPVIYGFEPLWAQKRIS